MDLEVFRVAGKSMVLPYVTTSLLLIPLLPRLRTAVRDLHQDRALPWLLGWFLAACASTAWILFSYQRAEMFDRNLTQLLNLLMMIGQYSLFVCALRATPPPRFGSIARALVWTAAAAGLYSLYQVAAVYAGLPAPDLFRTSNLYFKLNTLGPTGAGGWAGLPRAFGLAPEPSFWGAYLVFGAAFILGGIDTRPRPAPVAAFLLLTAAVLVTFSRSAWITLAILVALWGLSRLTTRLSLGIGAVILAVLALTTLPMIAGEEVLQGMTDLSAVGRLASQETAWRIFFDHPILGIGFGSAEFIVQRYNRAFASVSTFSLEHVYNFFLLNLVSTGIVGFTLFVGFLLTLAHRLTLAFNMQTADAGVSRLRLSAAFAYASCLGLWLNTPAYNFTFIWFGLALVSVLPTMIQEAQRTRSVPGGPCA